ncbi:MAG: four-carbon acid sugar kinase family protein [Anaerolineae bacterium]|nr:four-carbon acid sugar kinase family protein [Anaerolineae bacterium]
MGGLAVIADDLTGAMDTGLQFSKCGLDTAVSLTWRRLPSAEVVVVDTDSRAVRASVARERLVEVARLVGDRRVYKKVDSTMRGNVGYELRGLCQVLEPRAVVVAPAFPAGGRTTRWGRQCVNGRPLELTFFAHDPRWPMQESHLPTLLMRQAGQEIGEIPFAVVSGGPDVLVDALNACPEGIIVVDALHQAHLRTIASALVTLGSEWIPCGSAGLAEEWVTALGLAKPRPPSPECVSDDPVLVVAGSRNDVTLRQMEHLQATRSVPRIDLDPYHSYDEPAEIGRLVEACLAELRQGHDAILTASYAPLVMGAGDLVARVLAGAVQRILLAQRLCGLFLTGGDIAVAVCRALRGDALRIIDEVQAGIPGGILLGGPHDGLRVVTKAGGFGNERALADAVAYLRGQDSSTAR